MSKNLSVYFATLGISSSLPKRKRAALAVVRFIEFLGHDPRLDMITNAVVQEFRREMAKAFSSAQAYGMAADIRAIVALAMPAPAKVQKAESPEAKAVQPDTWQAAVERYLSSRDVSDYYKATLRLIGRKLVEFAGGSLQVDQVNDVLVNQWLESLKSTLSPKRLKHYRAGILSVWREEHRRGNVKSAPGFVRVVKVPQSTVHCWTLDELTKLITACRYLRGMISGQCNTRALFWEAFVCIAYDTGLRRGDVLSIAWSNVDLETGAVQAVQNKTGCVVNHWLSETTLKLVGRLDRSQPFVLHWPHHATKFDTWFRKLVEAAVIRRGTSRWIRRSAASYIERDYPDHAKRFLGHLSGDMARLHYLDPSVTNSKPIRPPELQKAAEQASGPVAFDMDALIAEINEEHRLALKARREFAASAESPALFNAATAAYVAHKRRCGELLCQAKQCFRWGEWLRWLYVHCKLSHKTAYIYMRFFREGESPDSKEREGG